MKISAVEIKNYKSLHNVSLKELGNLVILIGKNGSGKSNFLEILNRFFAEIDLTGIPSGIDKYSWFDGSDENPVEVTLTLGLDEKECDEVFPSEILKSVKDRFGERYRELTICRHIVKAPTGWQTRTIKWADVLLVEDGKPKPIKEIAKSLAVSHASLEGVSAVFFTPKASKENLVGERLVLVEPAKKAYLMSPYSDQLVREGKIKWVNISDKTTDWRKYASDEGYTLIEEGLTEKALQPELPSLKPEVVSEIISGITTMTKARFTLALAVRNAWPQNPLQRVSFLDTETQQYIRNLGMSEVRAEQRRWSKIEKTYKDFIGGSLEAHPNYLRVREADLPLPIQHRGGGEQELLFLLRFLTESGYIFAIEEPELHTHPQLARQIFYLLKSLSDKGNQIFVTTHSTIFIDHADLGNTWIVKKEENETSIARIKELKQLQDVLFELGVKPSDILFSNGIILVEGTTEKIVFPIYAEKAGTDLKTSVISIIPIRGKSLGRYHLGVWVEAAKTANIPYFMILDKDAEKEAKQFIDKKILVPNENLFVLKKGSIEDYYPQDKLIEAIRSEYSIDLDENDKRTISERPRVERIEELLRKKKVDTTSWKVKIGKRIAETIAIEEVDEEIRTIMERIRTRMRRL